MTVKSVFKSFCPVSEETKKTGFRYWLNTLDIEAIQSNQITLINLQYKHILREQKPLWVMFLDITETIITEAKAKKKLFKIGLI